MSGIPIPVGDLMDDHISFEFGIYYVPTTAEDPLKELDALLKDKFAALRRVSAIERHPTRLTISALPDIDPRNDYPMPDLEWLRRFGHGLTEQQAEDLQKNGKVLVLAFAHPKEHVFDGLFNAVKLAQALAQFTNGAIWDDATSEMFSKTAWEERRFKGWDEGVPDVAMQTTIHAYKKDECVRAITLGMSKFGLPDLVIEQFSWSHQRNVCHILNLFGQSLAEGATITKRGEFELDFRTIKNPSVREPQLATLKSNGSGIAHLSLRKGALEEGDPDNRLIEITFERGDGPDVHGKRNDILTRAFGSTDSIVNIQHDDEIAEASHRARTKLPSLQAEFNKGLVPGEFILVKAPFETPDGQSEWMWVEVNRWRGSKITGLLQNEPFNIPDLHPGQTVIVSEDDVFDYMRVHADGTTEGNETAALIEKQSE